MEHIFEAKHFMAVVDKACIDSIYCAELGQKKVRRWLHGGKRNHENAASVRGTIPPPVWAAQQQQQQQQKDRARLLTGQVLVPKALASVRKLPLILNRFARRCSKLTVFCSLRASSSASLLEGAFPSGRVLNRGQGKTKMVAHHMRVIWMKFHEELLS